MTARIKETLRTFGLTTEWAPSWWPPRLWRLWFWSVPGDIQQDLKDNRDCLVAAHNALHRRKAGQ
jgi:hypothetical protein